MLGNEGDRHHHQRHAVGSGPFDLRIGRRADPFQRTDPALVAAHPVQVGNVQFAHDRFRRPLALPLVRIAGLDDLLRQAMAGEQHARLAVGAGFLDPGADQAGGRLDEARFGRIAADRDRRLVQTSRLRRLEPHLFRRRRGRGGKLGIKRQKHDSVRIEPPDLLGGLVAHRVPVAHRDEGLDLAQIAERRLDRPGLGFGILQQRGLAAQNLVDLAGRLRPPPRQQIGQRRPEHAWDSENRRVVEQVEQERAHGVGAVRPAEIEEDDSGFLVRHGVEADFARLLSPGLRRSIDRLVHFGRLISQICRARILPVRQAVRHVRAASIGPRHGRD